MKRIRPRRNRDAEITAERALTVLCSDVRTRLSVVDAKDETLSVEAAVLHTHLSLGQSSDGRMDTLMVTVSVLQHGEPERTVMLRAASARRWAADLVRVLNGYDEGL